MICRYCNHKLTKTGENLYCSYCKIPFKKEEAIEKRTDLLKIPLLTEDPKFFAYTSVQELIDCLEVELLNYLGLARKFERQLKQKIYRAGRNNADEIDKQDLKEVRLALIRIENIYIERTGYYPPAVYPARVQMEIDKIKKLNQKLSHN